MFFLFRALTGFGIGGEYAAINSRDRRADPGAQPRTRRPRDQRQLLGRRRARRASCRCSSWTRRSSRPTSAGVWRSASARSSRSASCSSADMSQRVPRWLFIHGRQEEAERIVDQIEPAGARPRPGASCRPPEGTIAIRQRDVIPFRESGGSRSGTTRPARRSGSRSSSARRSCTTPSLSTSGRILHEFFDVASSQSPTFMVLFALSNFLGPLLLGRLFDTVGRNADDLRHVLRLRRFHWPSSQLLMRERRPHRRRAFMALLLASVLLRLYRRELGLPHVSARSSPWRRARSRSPSSTRPAPPSGGSPGRCCSGSFIDSGDRRPGRAQAS